MSKVDDYRQRLGSLTEWGDFLEAESRLPGPRGNLELAEAVADVAGADWILRNCTASPEEAPENTPACFVVCCATQGLGRLTAEGDLAALTSLRQLASDERWRVRESVAIALQRVGDADFARLLDVAEEWARGNWLEQRAAAAAICEPRLLKGEQNATRVFDLLDAIMKGVVADVDRRNGGFRALRQAMGYCFSVAISAWPEEGKTRIEPWLSSKDADVRWILRENLKKNRLLRLDPAWVGMCRERLEKATS